MLAISAKSSLKIERLFTDKNTEINFVERTAHITDNKGQTIFHQDKVIVPDFWSQTAINILAQKYFRQTGVPSVTTLCFEENIPNSLARRIPNSNFSFGGENSLKQVVDRLIGHWSYTGWKNNYFSSEDEALDFGLELEYMLYHQMAAPNSPQWFNTGLWWAYGIKGNKNNDHYAKAPSKRMPTKNLEYL